MATLTATTEDTRIYECCVLFPYSISQKEQSEAEKAVEALFDEAGAKQISVDKWGRRGLAYPINGHDEGNYIVYYYEMLPEKLRELDAELQIVPNVLRHIVIKPPKDYEVVAYSKKYDEWKKSQVDVEAENVRKKEEQLKEKMLEKQKRATKRAEAQKAEKKEVDETEKKPRAEEKKISAEIDKLISDDDLEM